MTPPKAYPLFKPKFFELVVDLIRRPLDQPQLNKWRGRTFCVKQAEYAIVDLIFKAKQKDWATFRHEVIYLQRGALSFIVPVVCFAALVEGRIALKFKSEVIDGVFRAFLFDSESELIKQLLSSNLPDMRRQEIIEDLLRQLATYPDFCELGCQEAREGMLSLCALWQNYPRNYGIVHHKFFEMDLNVQPFHLHFYFKCLLLFSDLKLVSDYEDQISLVVQAYVTNFKSWPNGDENGWNKCLLGLREAASVYVLGRKQALFAEHQELNSLFPEFWETYTQAAFSTLDGSNIAQITAEVEYLENLLRTGFLSPADSKNAEELLLIFSVITEIHPKGAGRSYEVSCRFLMSRSQSLPNPSQMLELCNRIILYLREKEIQGGVGLTPFLRQLFSTSHDKEVIQSILEQIVHRFKDSIKARLDLNPAANERMVQEAFLLIDKWSKQEVGLTDFETLAAVMPQETMSYPLFELRLNLERAKHQQTQFLLGELNSHSPPIARQPHPGKRGREQ